MLIILMRDIDGWNFVQIRKWLEFVQNLTWEVDAFMIEGFAVEAFMVEGFKVEAFMVGFEAGDFDKS